MTIVVFLGPSLPLAEARAILPDALYLPPARQADIVSVLDRNPSAIALIDGEFHQQRSVWHKEILLALEAGVHVFGASSMGALRAAELEPYGMSGVGTVFAAYASGDLVDDDEVGLVYYCEDGTYTPLSEPMVNIRATLEAAHRSGGVSGEVCGIAVEEVKSLHYSRRSRAAALEALRARGVDAGQVAALADFWRTSAVDVKADDARLLLRTLRDFAADPPPPRTHRVPVERTAALDILCERERRVRTAGVEVPLDEIAEFVHLHHPASETLNDTVLDRTLVLVLAELLQMEPDEADVEQELHRWRIRHRLIADSDLSSWLDRNHLTSEELRRIAADAALCRALRRWLLYSRRSQGTTRLVLDRLRWDGDYEQWAAGAAALSRVPTEPEPCYEDLETLAAEHRKRTGAPLGDDLASWAEECGFSSPEHLRAALLRARAGRPHLPEDLPRTREPADVAAESFNQKGVMR